MSKVAYVNVENKHEKSSVKNLTVSVSMCNQLHSLDHNTYVFHIDEDISNLSEDITKVQCENEMILIEEVFKILRDRDIVIFDLLSYSFEYLMFMYRSLGGNFTNLILDSDLGDDLFEIGIMKTKKYGKLLTYLNVDKYRYKYNYQPMYKMYCFHSIINNSQNDFNTNSSATKYSNIVSSDIFKSILEIEDDKDYRLITSLHMLVISHSLDLLNNYFKQKVSPFSIYKLVFEEILKYYYNSTDLEHTIIKQKSHEICKEIYMDVYYKQIELLNKGELIWNVSNFNSYNINNWLTNIVIDYINIKEK